MKTLRATAPATGAKTLRAAAWALAGLIAAGCASTAVSQPSVQAEDSACSVTVSFGSYGMGVDRALVREVEAYLATEPRVTKVDRRLHGREGEFDLCLTVTPAAEARAIFLRIGALIPARSDKAPSSVSVPGGETIRTQGLSA